MKTRNKQKEREEAFKLFKSGLTQKAIAQKVKVQEKTIGNWKKIDEWDKKLLPRKNTRVADAYLLVAENIRQQSFPPDKPGVIPIINPALLNEAITIIGQALSAEDLI